MAERITFAKFQGECRKLAGGWVVSRAWEMSFSSEDFDREWIVTARSGPLTASSRIFSANATATTAQEVVIGLGRMLAEMMAGDAEITPKQRAVFEELRAKGGGRPGSEVMSMPPRTSSHAPLPG